MGATLKESTVPLVRDEPISSTFNLSQSGGQRTRSIFLVFRTTTALCYLLLSPYELQWHATISDLSKKKKDLNLHDYRVIKIDY